MATSEVAAAITAFPGVTEASVYGVTVPGTEGAAGMAALVADGALDFAELRRHLVRRLPPYARPLFLRIASVSKLPHIQDTKTRASREGFRSHGDRQIRSISTIRKPKPTYRSTRRSSRASARATSESSKRSD